MAKASIATAYVTIVPDMRGSAAKIRDGIVTGAGSAGVEGGKRAAKAFSNGFSTIKVAAGNVLASGFTALTASINASLSNSVSRVDILNNFPRVMQNLGYSTDEATRSIQNLNEYVQSGIPTTLQDITSLTQQMAPLVGGLDEATEISKAFNDALVASGKNTQDQQRAMLQYTQMLSKGKVDMQSWNTLQEVMGAQLDQVGKKILGSSGNSRKLYDAMKSGKVTMDDFNKALLELDKKGLKGFGSFAQQAKDASGGIETSITNLKSAFVSGFASILDAIGQKNIANTLDNIKKKVKELFETVKPYVVDAVNEIQDFFTKAQPTFQMIGDIMSVLIPIALSLAKKLFQLAKAILSNRDAVVALASVFTAFKIYKHVQGVSALSVAFKKLGGVVGGAFGKIKDKIKPATKSITKFDGAAGKATKTMNKGSKGAKKFGKGFSSLFKNAAGFAAIGVSLLIIAGAFWVLSDAAVRLSATGGLGIAVMAGMVVAIAGLAVLFSALGTKLTAGAAGMIIFAAAILILAAAFFVLSAAAVMLSNAGGFAVGILAGFMVVIVALVVIFAIFGTALNAAIPFMIVFAAMIAVIALSITALVLAITLLVAVVTAAIVTLAPIIIEIVNTIANGIIGIISTVGEQIQGIIEKVGDTIVDVLNAIGDNISKVVTSITDGISKIIETTCDGIQGIIDSIGDAISGIIDSMTNFVNAIKDLGYALPLFAIYGPKAAVGLAEFSVQVGKLAFKGALVSDMDKFSKAIMRISSNGSGASTTLENINNAINKLPSSFESAATKIETACNKIKNIVNSMKLKIPKVTLSKLPTISWDAKKDKKLEKVTLTPHVNWYAKGGIFDRPSVVGVGEKGREGVIPLNRKVYKEIGNGIAANSTGSTNQVTINLNYSADADANQMVLDIARGLRRLNMVGA